MNMTQLFRDAAQKGRRRALPILSFPAAQRLGVSVRELVGSAELQAKAMALVANQTPSIAAVSLMDLSVEAEAFGAAVRFGDNEVPAVVGQLIGDAAAAGAVAIPQTGAGRTGLCVQAVVRAKTIIPNKPVLAGVIGPFSLAGRLMDVTEIMYACCDEPETVLTVVDKATRFISGYIDAFKQAGADGVVVAEPLAGLLSPDMAREFSNPAVKGIIDAVQTEEFPVVYHNCGSSVTAMLPELFDMRAAAYHFGNAVDMTRIMAAAPAAALCMGNIDPSGQFTGGTPESMRRAVLELLGACGSYENFVLSSGCDIPAGARWECIDAFFAALEEYNARG